MEIIWNNEDLHKPAFFQVGRIGSKSSDVDVVYVQHLYSNQAFILNIIDTDTDNFIDPTRGNWFEHLIRFEIDK